MKKRVIDLTDDELEKLASEAWFAASDAALKSGVPVVGREGDQIVKTFPDGRREVLGDAKPMVEASRRRGTTKVKKVRTRQARRSA